MTLLEQVAADSATFFNPESGFGIAATFTRQLESEAHEINVQFDRAFVADDMGGASVETSQNQMAFRTSDWPDAAQGDKVTIAGVDYTIQDPDDDGLGLTICTLTRNP